MKGVMGKSYMKNPKKGGQGSMVMKTKSHEKGRTMVFPKQNG